MELKHTELNLSPISGIRCSRIRVLAVWPPLAFWKRIVLSTTPDDFLFLTICGYFLPGVTLQKIAFPLAISVPGKVSPSVSKESFTDPYVSCFLNSEAGACLDDALDELYVRNVVDRPNPLSTAERLNNNESS